MKKITIKILIILILFQSLVALASDHLLHDHDEFHELSEDIEEIHDQYIFVELNNKLTMVSDITDDHSCQHNHQCNSACHAFLLSCFNSYDTKFKSEQVILSPNFLTTPYSSSLFRPPKIN